ncbi:glutaredoxin family protein [Paenibacillus koleovorans]|uniref:glutaredoxin family protein n=1 Tax=Paenibacillus koleovorans TaxID=121608 RepID=UPI000FD81E46|nr:glutaredoxin family protein [Paenibacillus koleovorans]
MSQAIVYSAKGCQDCEKVKQYLSEQGVAFEVKDVMADVQAREEVEKLGFLGIPVTVIGDQAVKGFQPGELKRMVAAVQ